MDIDFDNKHLWHPYTSMAEPTPVFPVSKTQGCEITLETGEVLIDGMASWWSAIHGYNHPQIISALKQQTDTMPHVMFGGLTHEPAIELGKKLLAITPEKLDKIFLADSGSIAVEVALKMAIQFQYAQGQTSRNKMLTVRNGYHGDTFGAMAVTDPEGSMHSLYQGILAEHFFAPAPQSPFEADGKQHWQENDFTAMRELMLQNQNEIAAVIIEPIVQGAGGMRFYHPEYLRQLRKLCDETGALLIFDEIATGFGRTGKMFALEWACVTPDILCVGKALTGGVLTLAATLTTEHVALTLSQNGGALMHGPTFMANPLACAAANASLDILASGEWQEQVHNIETKLTSMLGALAKHPRVADVRILGAIGVVELNKEVDMKKIQQLWVDHGVWIRPFGKLIYIMPPYTISSEQLTVLCRAIIEVVGSKAIF